MVERALAGAPASGSVDPWLGWLLLCLCRQRARQTWLLQVHRIQLKGAAQDRPGDVPGLAGWRYDYHGGALCLLGPDGESVEVQITSWSVSTGWREQDGATIDQGFFAFGVDGEKARGLAGRVWRWLPGIDLILAGVRELRAAGLLVGEHHIQLCERLELLYTRVAALDLDAPAVLRRLGPLAGDPEPQGRDVRQVLARHHAWLLGLLADRVRAGGVIDAVGREVGPESPVRVARELLAGPIDWTTAATVDALEHLLDGPDDAVVALLDRLVPDQPHAARAVVRYLLSRGVERPRAVAALRTFAVHGPERGNVAHFALAVLALEHAVELTLPILRSALRSKIPLVYLDTAALLVALDLPWCRRELAAVLEEPRDPEELERLRRVVDRAPGAWQLSRRVDVERLRQRLPAEL